MKINLKEKEFKLWTVVSIVLSIIWFIVILTIYQSQSNNEKVFLKEELEGFEGEVNSTLTTYQAFSNYIFDEINEDEEIIEIMHEANFASIHEKEILRKQLYDKLYDKYLRMKKYEYRQLHFHLPNTESFLRVHSPDKYGDLLAGARESVLMANEKLINVSGFEEGRIFNGFRFVYPLIDDNTHIGSVEISISSASIIEVISKLYENEDFYFIIEKSIVKENVFDEEMVNYKDSDIHDDYYVDKEVSKITNNYNTIVPDSRKLFFKEFKEEYRDNLERKESFSAIYNFKGKDYTIKFLAIENLKEDPVAYLISISESIGYEKFSKTMYQQIVLVTVLVIFVVIFGLLLAFYQNRLKKSSEIDHLTKLYNRSKFYDIVKRESKLSKRYKYDSSIMLIDIDYFKKINDTYGHAWGDKVLKNLANEISKNIRDTDVFARWGGEEFVLLLPYTSKDNAVIVAEKLRLLIDESRLDKLKDVTISIGVAKIDSDHFDVDSAIKLADDAMYCAKRSGRNQVCSK